MAVLERTLMGPGPSNPYPEATAALSAPMLGHLDPAFQSLGLELWVQEGHRLPELTTVLVPDGVDPHKVRAQLLERFSIEIGAGVGPHLDQMWRIGCMGHTARPANVALLLAALAEVLGR